MDRNQVTGLLLIIAMLLGYQFFVAPKIEPTKPEESKKVTKTVPQTTPKAQVDTNALKAAAGDFAAVATGTAQDIVLENKDIKVTFTTHGGKIKQVVLKNFKTYNSFAAKQNTPLTIYDESFDKVSFELPTNKGKIDLYKLYFNQVQVNKNADPAKETAQSISFALTLANGQQVAQTYTLAPSGFLLDQQVKLTGLDGVLKNESVQFNWSENVQATEKDLNENRKATVNYLIAEDEEFDQLSENPSSANDATLEKPLTWVSFKKKYFLSGFITKNQPIEKAQMWGTPHTEDSVNIKTLRADMALPLADLKTGKGQYQWYFGPNDYNAIKNIAPGFGKNVKLSYDIFLPITRYVFVPLFNVLETVFSNYGLLIIVLVLIIKTALLPLTYKSYVSMAKMRILQPELNAIKEKIGDDAAKLQQAQMKLYGEVGVSPLSGCVPVLATMPILMAVFMLFPNLINLRQEAFLWANDLSTYDSVLDLPFSIPFYGNHVSLFTLLMTISSVAYGYYNNQNTPDQPGQPIDMKKMAYITPVIFMFVMNSLPAGMSFYYFVSNLVTILQQIGIRKFVDEDKIKQILDENRKKIAAGGGKKSRFSEYLSKQMKAAEEMQKQEKDKKKKH